MRNKGGQEDGIQYIVYWSRTVVIDALFSFNLSWLHIVLILYFSFSTYFSHWPAE